MQISGVFECFRHGRTYNLLLRPADSPLNSDYSSPIFFALLTIRIRDHHQRWINRSNDDQTTVQEKFSPPSLGNELRPLGLVQRARTKPKTVILFPKFYKIGTDFKFILIFLLNSEDSDVFDI